MLVNVPLFLLIPCKMVAPRARAKERSVAERIWRPTLAAATEATAAETVTLMVTYLSLITVSAAAEIVTAAAGAGDAAKAVVVTAVAALYKDPTVPETDPEPDPDPLQHLTLNNVCIARKSILSCTIVRSL